jgi:WD40 repeat protein
MTFAFDNNERHARFVLALLCVLFALTIWAVAQRRSPTRISTAFDDVVFSISFSPDGRTLAIARGAGEPSQRYGRIELWDTETGTLRHVIKGFDGPVRSVSFSPDGQTLVSGSSEYRTSKIREKVQDHDGTVLGELKWWDATTGELKHKLTLPGEGNSSLRATYSPDGKQLAIVESFTQISYLSPSASLGITGPISPNPVPARSVGPSMFFSADLKLLDAQTGELKLKLSSSQLGRAMFSPDGELIAAWNSREVKLWNARTGEVRLRLKGFKGQPNTIAFSPDGQLLAVAITEYDSHRSARDLVVTAKSEVRLFDVLGGKVTRKLPSVGAVNSLSFEPGGRFLLIGGVLREKDRVVAGLKLWDFQTGNSANLTTAGVDSLEFPDSLVLSRSGDLLALRSDPATVQLLGTQAWNVKQTFDANGIGDRKERPTNRFVLSVRRVVAVAFSADGNTLSGELEQGEIKLWDHRTGEVKKQVAAGEETPSLVAIASDGQTLADVGNGTLRVWNVTGEAKRTLSLPGVGPLTAIALSANGQTLAAVAGKDIKLLHVATGEVLKTLVRRQTMVNRLEFSNDGRALASAGEDGAIEIWDLASERIEKTINAGGKVTALRFSRDGHTLASATEDRAIDLWDLQSGALQQRLQKHSAMINALAFSPDGRLLASGSDDRTVIIWDTVSGRSRRTLKGHDQTVTSLAFSPDGSLIASAGGNASVVLWEVRTGKLNRVLK